jgi:hypothetical protein
MLEVLMKKTSFTWNKKSSRKPLSLRKNSMLLMTQEFILRLLTRLVRLTLLLRILGMLRVLCITDSFRVKRSFSFIRLIKKIRKILIVCFPIYKAMPIISTIILNIERNEIVMFFFS